MKNKSKWPWLVFNFSKLQNFEYKILSFYGVLIALTCILFFVASKVQFDPRNLTTISSERSPTGTLEIKTK